MSTPTASPAPVITDHLQRLNTLKKHDPYIHAIFVGWMCGAASAQRMRNSQLTTVAKEVEAFLSTYEASATAS